MSSYTYIASLVINNILNTFLIAPMCAACHLYTILFYLIVLIMFNEVPHYVTSPSFQLLHLTQV
jgi:hypothetical protein